MLSLSHAGLVLTSFTALWHLVPAQKYISMWKLCPLKERMQVPVPIADLLLNIYRQLSHSLAHPPPPPASPHQKVPVYHTRHCEQEPPHVTRASPVTSHSPRPSGDTVSISCEQGTFLVPPLLFSFSLGKKQNLFTGPGVVFVWSRAGKCPIGGVPVAAPCHEPGRPSSHHGGRRSRIREAGRRQLCPPRAALKM